MKSVLFSVCLLFASEALANAPTRIEIVSPKGSPSRERAGDVVVTLEDGHRERLTEKKHCLDPKLGPDGLVGWTWASERYEGSWVNSHLHVQRGKKTLVDVKASKPFIEDWAFVSQGVVAKSRATHGPSTVGLFALEDGHRLGITDSTGENLPAWAEPFKE